MTLGDLVLCNNLIGVVTYLGSHATIALENGKDVEVPIDNNMVIIDGCEVLCQVEDVICRSAPLYYTKTCSGTIGEEMDTKSLFEPKKGR